MIQSIQQGKANGVRSGNTPARHTNWVRQGEHAIVRLGSLALSIVSGDAIYWFFSFMNGIDRLQPAMTTITAVAIGLLGYVILRALTHRLLHHERIWVYIPLCFTLVAVETVANFMKAIVGVHDDRWLAFVPHPLLGFMTVATYVVLSIMPAFTIFLAYVDMDLDRAKHSTAVTPVMTQGQVNGKSVAPITPMMPQTPNMPKTPPASQYPTQAFGMTPGVAPTSGYPSAPAPVFAAGMNNMPRYAPAAPAPVGANGYSSVYQRP